MNWMTILTQLFEMVIFPLLGIATVYLVFLIKAKINELKLKEDDDLFNASDFIYVDENTEYYQSIIGIFIPENNF